MVAPPVGQDQAEAAVKSTKPLPRAIKMVTKISSLLDPSTTASTETIEEHGVCRFYAGMKLVVFPFMFIATAVFNYYYAGDDADDDGGGFVLPAVLFLPIIYLAVVQAAEGYLDLFAPRTPYAAWVALHKVGFASMGGAVLLTSLGALLLYMLMPCEAWLLLVACACLFGLLVASTIAFWLCLRRTYALAGGERREKISSSRTESVIDGLAYLYTRILYEYAVRWFMADADGGTQQLDTDSVTAAV